jgi:8-amino-7-oxononanoate synthase
VRPLSAWDVWIDSRLERLEGEGLMRRLQPGDRTGASHVWREGRDLVNFSSNDYLGLSVHPAVMAGAERDLRKAAGATASRLMTGTDFDYVALENAVAFFKGTEAALVFGSGYLANAGTIAALAGHGDAVFSDRLNHASIVDGILLSGAAIRRYRHNDMDDLEQMLREHRGTGRKLIVTETVFGMDGDRAPMERLVELKNSYRAALMVDEAHATGVLGPQGRGLAHELGVADQVDVHMGTFSKAVGVYGGYVATKASWAKYLVNAARTFVYTTALPPAVVGAVGAAIEMVIAADYLRDRLRELSALFREGLDALGLGSGGSTSHIQPVIVGDSVRAVELGRRLEEMGVLAVPVRPPTVPQGSARLRFSICATHTERDVASALRALESVRGDLVAAG